LESLKPLPPSSHAVPVDGFPQAVELQRELEQNLRGEVRFDRGSRAIYATDGSNYRHIPIGLVIPRDEQDVIATVAACRKYGAPVLARGGGTSLAGQCCNVAVVLDFSKYMNNVLEIDPQQKIARVQPGVVLDTLRNQAEAYQLTFGPDPATHNRCTLGGMIGNNSCGVHSLLAGKTVDNVLELRVLLYDGTQMTVGPTSDEEFASIIAHGGLRAAIYAKLRAIRDQYGDAVREKFPRIPRRVSGYNLDELLPENNFNVARALVGSEGTCVVILEAKLKLISSPQHRTLVGLGYADAFEAADHVPEILMLNPIGLEGFEGSLVEGLWRKGEPDVALLPEGKGFLLVEFGAHDPQEAQAAAVQLVQRLAAAPDGPNARIYTKEEARKVWKIRETGVRSSGFVPGAPLEWEGWDDSAVAPAKLGAYLRDLRRLLDEYHYTAAFYGHFGHGCMHMRVTFDLLSEKGIHDFQEFMERAADLVIGYGGSLSGEHGDGQARAALLPKMFGPDLMQAFVEFKSAWDPGNKMNPNKLVNAHGVAEDLRLGADYKPIQLHTHFQFPDDGGSLSKAALRCVGLGECRKDDAETMCPSYRVTREEKHSTRGRAHMLFELLQGEALTGGWENEEVKSALDLCLSCKACKSECPASVDIATYRAEFLSHYYEKKPRPLSAHIFGQIDRWAKLGSIAPAIANFLSHAPLVAGLLRRVLHLAPERQMPKLAATNFRSLAAKRNVATFWTAQVPGGTIAAQGLPKLASPLPLPSQATRAANLGAPSATHESNKELSSRSEARDLLYSDSGAAAPSEHAPKDNRVILWVDTFNNYFHPETSQAAVEVLQDAGFEVLVPRDHLCCGRPLYDFGLLDKAKQYLQQVLQALGPAVEAGLPVVVLEPSCASVFRDELRSLFPKDERATKLRHQTFLLSEFLERNAPNYEPAHLDRKVLLHGHCHQKALMKTSSAEKLIRKMGADLQTLDSGCCGMAGAFGFEKEKYAVSQAIGERVLLPAVRQAAAETIIVSDGFSCREQISQATGRHPLHFAELLNQAKRPSGL
jgi:FAD/FMN-containing dehydrogenase/Fe-S oxidoreductase